jgi:macrolide-specific efflux system membrane fusion protein
MKLKIALILVMIVAGGGAIFVSLGGLSARAADTTYLTSAAVVGNVSDDVAATGAIEPVESYGLTFGSAAHLVDASATTSSGSNTATWAVTSVGVAVGDKVTKGQKVATASTSDLDNQLVIATANRRSAQLQLATANDQLDAATSDDAIRQAKMSVYNAEAQLAQARASERDLKAQIAAATLVAPVDGVVSAVNVAKGYDAPSGDAIVIDTTTYEVTADVVESDISSVTLGQPATISVDAIDGQIDGTVAAIAASASTTDSGSGSVVSYAVTVTLGSVPAGLRPGMTADVAITTASATGVLTIPSAALTGSAGAYSVRVLDAAGVAETREVTVGLVTSSVAEITSGLTVGEAVITGTSADRTATQTTNAGGGFGGAGGFGGGGFRPGAGGGGQGGGN